MDIKAFFKISYGMYIVSSFDDKKFNGQIANTVFQVTAEPPQFAVCINKNNLTNEYIKKSKIFTISVLSKETPMKFIGLFGFNSGRKVNKFKDIEYKIGTTGAPIVLENCLSYFECKVVNSIETETHTLFIGKVMDAQLIKDDEPMTYAYYHTIKQGLTQKNAPTYIKGTSISKNGGLKMAKYKCTVCGYIYNPEKGDPDSGIKPGTPFEDLPDDWVCPVCGATKDAFEKEVSYDRKDS